MLSGASNLDVVCTQADLAASLGVLVLETDHEEDVPPRTGLVRTLSGSGGYTTHLLEELQVILGAQAVDGLHARGDIG